MKLSISDERKWESDSSTQKVFNLLKKKYGEERDKSICYYGYPTYSPDNSFEPSLVWVDKEFGLIVLKIYSYNSDQVNNMDNGHWVVNGVRTRNEVSVFEDYMHLLNSNLTRPAYGLNKIIKPRSAIIFPFYEGMPQTLPEKLSGLDVIAGSLENYLGTLEKVNLTDEQWKKLVSIVQKMDSLNKNVDIKIDGLPQDIGDAIIRNDQKICIFDDAQEDSAMKIPFGGMRIRGIAGTGKTIILAWKAAYLHSKFPDKKILYTFNTKSLYNQIERLVRSFYRKYSNEEPNWKNIMILHAWGGSGKSGVYYKTCLENNLKPETMAGYKHTSNPFGVVCSNILKNDLNSEYDYVLVDEAQDLPIEFFKLIEKTTNPSKNIVIAYDELQNTEDLEIPNFGNLFGLDNLGRPKVFLKEEDDFILNRSYRNHRKVLHLALAFGFGLYSKEGLIQVIDKPENWRAIGFEVLDGNLEPNQFTKIERPEENSPNNIEKIYSKEDILNVKSFESKDEELKFVSNKIIELVEKENVKPEDIMVINLSTKPSGDFTLLNSYLSAKGIESKAPGMEYQDASDFFVPNFVTLSTPRRSKGNECPIVFVIGADRVCSHPENKVSTRLDRSFAFVALTRAKCWCYVTGTGNNMKSFMEEYGRIVKDYPILKFRFPNEKELEEIKQINYITKDEKAKKEFFESVEAVKKLLKSKGRYIPEDVKKELMNYLKDNNA